MGWLNGYSKRKELVLTGGSSGAQTDFQLSIAVSYEAAMQGDFDDIRFTRADGTTLVDAWAEVIINDTSATVWVEFPSTPANTVEQTYYMYYGNGAVASYWDGDATFAFFDDFDTDGWTDVGSNIYVNTTNSHLYAKGVRLAGDYSYISHTPPSDWSFDFLWKPIDAVTGSGACWGLLYYGLTATAQNFNVPNNAVLLRWQESGATKEVFLYIRDNAGTYHTSTKWGAYSMGTQYKIQISKSGTNFYLKVFSLAGAELFSTSLTGITVQNLAYIEVSDHASACNSQWVRSYNDDFRTRKYASGPSTYAFGAEESAPTGAAPTSIFYGPFGGPLGGVI